MSDHEEVKQYHEFNSCGFLGVMIKNHRKNFVEVVVTFLCFSIKYFRVFFFYDIVIYSFVRTGCKFSIIEEFFKFL